METRAFAPLYAPSSGTNQGGMLESITVAATNASATASAVFPASSGWNQFVQIRVANKTSAWAHCSFGVFGNIEVATVADDLAVAPGAVEVFTVAAEVSGVSVILDAAPSGSSSIMFTRGEGV